MTRRPIVVPGVDHDTGIDLAVVADDHAFADIASRADETALANNRIRFDDCVSTDAGGGRDFRRRIDHCRGMNRRGRSAFLVQQRCRGGESQPWVRIDQQRLVGGNIAGRLAHDDRAGVRIHGVFEMAVVFDEHQVAGLRVSDARHFGDLDASIADETGSGEFRECLQGLRHGTCYRRNSKRLTTEAGGRFDSKALHSRHRGYGE